MKKQKGFTLIELLVVVAVIAILASVVLVNLRGAREKATDSRVITAMGQVRSTAEIIYSKHNGYNETVSGVNKGVCDGATLSGNEGLDVLKADIKANSKDGTEAKCYAGKDDYCVSAPLKAGGFWCVDAKGTSKRVEGDTDPCTSANKCS